MPVVTRAQARAKPRAPSPVSSSDSGSDENRTPVRTRKSRKPKRTDAERKARALEVAKAWYAANKARALAARAKRYLAQNPKAKIRHSTAVNIGLIKKEAKPELTEAEMLSRVHPAFDIKPIKQTAVDPHTSKYPPLSYLGVRDWILNRTDRPLNMEKNSIRSLVSAFKQTMSLMVGGENIEAIDSVVPVLNDAQAVYEALKEHYSNVSTRQKNLEVLWQITKFYSPVVLHAKRGLFNQYADYVAENKDAAKEFERSKQADPAYAVPEFKTIMETVKDELGEDSQAFLFLCVYRDTVGRYDYGELRVADTIAGMDLEHFKNWYVKNGDADKPKTFDPIIYVRKHKTGKTSQGGVPKEFAADTQRLLYAFFKVPANKNRLWLFQDDNDRALSVAGLGPWFTGEMEKAGLFGLQIADLRQSMATELKKHEKTMEDTRRNAELMGHSIATHATNYGRMTTDEVIKNKQNQQIEPTFELKTKIGQRGRKQEQDRRAENEKAAMAAMLQLARS